MHLARGFREIGYHYFIRRDGTVETGRDLSQPGRFETGAHSQGENGESVGICYEGGVTLDDRTTGRDTRTPAQTAAMIGLIRDLLRRFPDAKVEGHRDMPFAATQCPGFDGAAWWASVVADAAGSGAGAVGPDPDRDVMPADDEVQRLRWRLAEIRDRAVAALDGL
ncbi:N-acetylmuramoyl-L-alanine amidase [Jannaschia faecimaris]|uniref:N-acetylmuramoyl-L-alanine amidase n=2 Tax=Jannaschia faecimaris TaxID=1244108 RepID=A0A1H3UK84_9RHOB|nr:N-acetylmuramoyl-L-alanine amidase [Jannaschia faecimaris]